MDAMLYKRCAKHIYAIPEGLRELMSDISREVIRSQPERLYTFVADYLDALMITRQNARVAAKLVESISQIGITIAELLEITGMSRREADKLTSIIQNAFRRYMASKSKQPPVQIYDEYEDENTVISQILEEYGMYCEDELAAVQVIQKAFRMFKDRQKQEKQLLTGMIDWLVAARSAVYLYRKTGVTHEETNRAAALIKAAYKGYYTRRIMQRLVDAGQATYEDDEKRETPEEVEEESKSIEFGEEYPSRLSELQEVYSPPDLEGLGEEYSKLTSPTHSERPPSESAIDTTAFARNLMHTVIDNVVAIDLEEKETGADKTKDTSGPSIGSTAENEKASTEGSAMPEFETGTESVTTEERTTGQVISDVEQQGEAAEKSSEQVESEDQEMVTERTDTSEETGTTETPADVTDTPETTEN